MMGDGLVKFYKDSVKKEWKLAFYAAFVSCLLIHLYKFTNTLPCHDSFFNVYSNQDMVVSGRWFLRFAGGISSYFDLPWINGLLCAVYLGLTAAIATEIFELKNPVVVVLSAVILTATPSTTETLFFGFTADGYLLGLMLSALAACLSCKGKSWRGYAAAGACLCLSCAIYQAYVSFAAVLCIFFLVLRLLDVKISLRDSWKWIGNRVHLLTELLESDLLYDNERVYGYLTNVFGLDYAKTTAQQLTAVARNPLVQEMGIWPAEDSVAVIDGVLVIKLSGESSNGE